MLLGRRAAGRRAARGLRRVEQRRTAICRPRPKRETDLTAPISPYGAAKLAAELYCQAFCGDLWIETVALRYFNVFGPRQDPNSEYSAVIPKFITALLAGKRPVIFGDGQQARDFTYVANVVHGNLLAADAPRSFGAGVQPCERSQHSLLALLAALNRLLGLECRHGI